MNGSTQIRAGRHRTQHTLTHLFIQQLHPQLHIAHHQPHILYSRSSSVLVLVLVLVLVFDCNNNDNRRVDDASVSNSTSAKLVHHTPTHSRYTPYNNRKTLSISRDTETWAQQINTHTPAQEPKPNRKLNLKTETETASYIKSHRHKPVSETMELYIIQAFPPLLPLLIQVIRPLAARAPAAAPSFITVPHMIYPQTVHNLISLLLSNAGALMLPNNLHLLYLMDQ